MARTPAASSRLSNGDGSPRLDQKADRLARLEDAVAMIQQTLDVQFKRIAAIQAQLDHLSATRSQ